MFGLRYHMTFIDEVPAPDFKRAESAPPRMDATTAKEQRPFQYEDRVSMLQVSKLQERSQRISADAKSSPLGITSFKEAPSLGSYGHPNLCCRPCIHFIRGKCEKSSCGFCHFPHGAERRRSFDKQQREWLKTCSEVNILKMLLPYIRKQVEENELPQALELLRLLESEISIRSDDPNSPPNTCRRVRYVLERMTLRELVSLACSTMPGRFPKLLSNELKKVRESVRMMSE